MGINQTVTAKILWWNAMPDQDYWIVDWKVGVWFAGLEQVQSENLAFLDLIVKKAKNL